MLADRFLVLNGDVLCDLDLTALIAQHEERDARATIALYPVEDPTGYGIDPPSRGRRDHGVPGEAGARQIDTDEINAGAYCWSGRCST